jgi:rubredoxin
MPRQLVSPKLKRMVTMNVNITETTNEEIYNHLNKKIAEIQPLFNEAKELQNKMVYLVFNKNPYENCNWRNKGPVRIEFNEWMNNDDKWFHFLKSLFDLRHDLGLYIYSIQEKTSDISELEYSLLKFNLNYEDEFNMYEKFRYNQAKKEWEIRDAEWIIEKKEKDNHYRNHKTEEQWHNIDKKIKEGFFQYDYPLNIEIKNTRVSTCKYCIRDNEEDKEREERIKQDELKQEERNRKWFEQKEQERIQQLENRHLYECKLCDYKTYDSNSFDNHEDSKEHKRIIELRKYYCEDCDVQSRNSMEHVIHKQTKKHKIKIGEIQIQSEYKCDLCNYVTGLKQNYDKHCSTKQHKEKVLL